MNSWYFLNADAVAGPVSTDGLADHAANGVIDPDTLVWSELEETPQPAVVVPEVGFFFSEDAIRHSESALDVSPMPLRITLVAWSTIAAAALSGMALLVWSFLWFGSEDLGSHPGGRVALIILGFAGCGFWIISSLAVLRGTMGAIRRLWRSQIPIGLAGLCLAIALPNMRGLALAGGLSLLCLGGVAFGVEGCTVRWLQATRPISDRS